MFNTVPISMAERLKSEPNSLQCRREMRGMIDEKDGVRDVVFLLHLPQKPPRLRWSVAGEVSRR
jgi:hypothetical protein